MSPADVDEWPAQMVEDALERIAAEGEWQREQDAAQSRRRAYEGTGGMALDGGFPALEA